MMHISLQHAWPLLGGSWLQMAVLPAPAGPAQAQGLVGTGRGRWRRKALQGQ